METIKINVELFIESKKLTTEEIDTFLSTNHDRVWKKGQKRGRTEKVFETDGWFLTTSKEFGNEEINLINLDELIDRLLDRLNGREELIRELPTEVIKGVSVWFEVGATLPPIIFDPKTLRRISQMGCSLEVDIMQFLDEELG